MIARDDDDRPRARIAERVEQPPELRVRERHFRVVRPLHRPRKPRRIVLRRRIRRVRIVHVDPGEERLLGLLPQPSRRLIHHFVPRPLRRVDPRRELVLREVEVVEIGVEPLSDPPPSVEDERADEPAGAVALPLQHLGQGRLLIADVELAVVADAVEGRERAGEQRCVRRQRQRRDRRRLREAQPARGEAVEDRGLRRGVAVGADAIRAERINRDDQDVRFARRACGQPRADEGGNKEDGNGCGNGPAHCPNCTPRPVGRLSRKLEAAATPSRHRLMVRIAGP